MVGIARIRLTRPPVATAPAPIYNTYAPRISFGVIALISLVPGAIGTPKCSPKNLIIGINSKYDITPPAAMIDAMRGPMM